MPDETTPDPALELDEGTGDEPKPKPTRPATRDHLPKGGAAEAEARATSFDVEYRGETYAVDPSRMHWETLEDDENGRYLNVIRAFVGDEALERFKASTEPFVWDDGELINTAFGLRSAIIAALGNL